MALQIILSQITIRGVHYGKREQAHPPTERSIGPSSPGGIFSDLSDGTEFGSYKDPQWSFLFGGEEITRFAIGSGGGNENNADNPCLDGCYHPALSCVGK